MSLELTTTRRRAPLAETVFVTKQPPYIQTYIGETGVQTVPPYQGTYVGGLGRTGVMQQRLRRRHMRLQRGLNETVFVTKQPPYIQTYIGDLGARMYDAEGRALAARMYDSEGRAISGHSRTREMMGFGALDSTVSTRELQTLLRQAGYCQTGAVDNLWGRNTAGAMIDFVEDLVVREGSRAYGAATDWAASNRSNTVRIDSGLLGKLRFAAAGNTDSCPSRGTRTPRPDTGVPDMEDEFMEETPGVLSNPMLWLGVAAVAAVGIYAYTQSGRQDDMMMMPPRL